MMGRIICLAIIALLSLAVSIGAADLIGRASIIDGDTIEIHGQRIRLYGIDAPESSQLCETAGEHYRCGQQAALALADYLGQRTVICQPRGRHFERIVAACKVAGEDIGSWLVSRGWALAFRRYSTDYIDEETQASAGKVGIWRGTFTPPWEWRQDH